MPRKNSRVTKEQRKQMSERMKLSWAIRKATPIASLEHQAPNPLENVTVFTRIFAQLVQIIDAAKNEEDARIVIGTLDMAKRLLADRFNL